MKRHADKRRGATSVMMVFLLVVLIVFGLLAFLSAYGNYKLGQSGKTWYEQSYTIDSIGEEVAAQMDDALRDAEKKAYDMAVGNTALAQEAAALASLDRKALFERLYLYFSARELSVLGIDVRDTSPDLYLIYGDGFSRPEDFLDPSKPVGGDILILDAKLTSQDGRRFLLLSFSVQPPVYKVSGQRLLRTDVAGQRYSVMRWQQQQPELKPDGGDFDGTVE